jgi:hypothetical protein
MNLKDLKNAKEGWLNFIKSKSPSGVSADVRAMAEARAIICQQCPHLDARKVPNVFGSMSLKYKCGKCGCAFPALAYASNKECPIKKW